MTVCVDGRVAHRDWQLNPRCLIAPVKRISCAGRLSAVAVFDRNREEFGNENQGNGSVGDTRLCCFCGCREGAGSGPRVQKLADGVYVHAGKGFDSNSGIILTEEGVVVIDTGQNPIESRDIMATVKKLTSMPVRLVIDTEPHADHTTGHYVFSPPAIIVAAAGGGEFDARRRPQRARIGSRGLPRPRPR